HLRDLHSFPTRRSSDLAYFDQTGKSMTGNFGLYLKAAVLGMSFLGLYTHLVFFTPPAFFAIVECVLFGCVISAIGFNVMHDGGQDRKSTRLNSSHLVIS